MATVVGHWSRRVDRLVGLLWVMSYIGIRRVVYQRSAMPPQRGRKSIPVLEPRITRTPKKTRTHLHSQKKQTTLNNLPSFGYFGRLFGVVCLE
jgi:hypothetical protein